jgi:uncharacterized protein (TIGR00255 family)
LAETARANAHPSPEAMIASMTGYASATRDTARGSLSVELRSVNHRYLEFACRIPEDLRALEAPLREAVAARLARGKVDCRVTLSPAAGGAKALSPDAATLAALHAASLRVREAFPQARELSVADVLHWPGVLAEDAVSGEALREEVLALAAAALDELDQARRREGAKLERGLLERLESMAALAREAAPLIPAAIASFRDKLAARIAEAAAAASDERLQQEVVLYAARIDVDEELQRLEAHVAECRRVIAGAGACGKRLDFLCQELNREANTLGSKSPGVELTRISMQLKVLIEQMREQVQNIE